MKHTIYQVLFVAAIAAFSATSHALPVFFSFEYGEADIATSGSSMLITSGADVEINWHSFDIAAGETVTFIGNNPGVTARNRVDGGMPMVISGQMNLINENVDLTADSIQFGGTVNITGNALCLTTIYGGCSKPVTPGPVTGGSMLQMTGGDLGGSVLVRTGGDLALVGIPSSGTIPLPIGGTIMFAPGLVTLVPEPESFAMLFAGLLVMLRFAPQKNGA